MIVPSPFCWLKVDVPYQRFGLSLSSPQRKVPDISKSEFYNMCECVRHSNDYVPA